MGNTLMSLLVALGLDSSTLDAGLEKSEKKSAISAGKIGSSLLSIGKVAMVGSIAIAGAVTMTVKNFAEEADAIDEMSIKTGIGTKQLQELAYVGNVVGVPLDTITGSLSFLTRNMNAAKGGTGAQAEAFAQLGISILDANGNFRDAVTVQGEVFAALNKVPNETERNALAMSLFGRSAMELNPLIKTSTEELAALKVEANESGAVMSDAAIKGGAALSDSFMALQASAKGLVGTLASSFVPMFQDIVDGAKKYETALSKILSEAGGDTTKIAAGVGKLVGQIVSDIALGLPKMIEMGFKIFSSIVTGLLSNLPAILQAGLTMIITLVKGIAETLPTLIPQIVQVIIDLVKVLLDNLPMLVEAGIALLLGLLDGIVTALPILIKALPDIIVKTVDALMRAMPLLLTASGEIIFTLVDGIITSLPVLIQAIPQIVEGIVKAIGDNFPLILDAGWKVIVMLGQGIANACVNLWTQVKKLGSDIITNISQGISNMVNSLWSRVVSIGYSIVNGIVSGIQGAWQYLVNTVTGGIDNLIAGIKYQLGISSPSKLFAGIGQNMALGLTGGFYDNLSGLDASLVANVTKNVSSVGGSPGMSPTTSSPVLNEEKLARILRDLMVMTQ